MTQILTRVRERVFKLIEKKLFGIINDKEVYCYKLNNGKNLSAEILSYGGIIKNLFYKNTDVVLGRDTLEEYLDNDGYYGALIGRNSNRIRNSEFSINGEKFTLAKNDGENNLHGGIEGFNKKIWNVEEVNLAEPSLILTAESKDFEEGFPGNAKIKVTYTITKEDSLKIHYEAICDKDTVMNLTNHSYFNLNGHDSGTIDNHKLQISSSFFTPNTDQCMPNGEILKSEGTPFDLRNGKTLEECFNSGYKQIDMFGGFDHNFVLEGRGFRKVATLWGDKTGIIMECSTDLPGVQIYTGNCIDEMRICKNGEKYAIHQAVCLETQFFPNALEFSHFPSPILKAGEKYDTVTEYKFK